MGLVKVTRGGGGNLKNALFWTAPLDQYNGKIFIKSGNFYDVICLIVKTGQYVFCREAKRKFV